MPARQGIRRKFYKALLLSIFFPNFSNLILFIFTKYEMILGSASRLVLKTIFSNVVNHKNMER